MPSTISLNVVNSDATGIDSLYNAVPASRTVYAQTLVNYIRDARFPGQFAANSIPITKLQTLNSSKIQTQSLSGAVNQPTERGQIAWYSINSFNIAHSGIDTASINNKAVTRHKIGDGSIFLEHFTQASLDEFANKISTGQIAQKVNRAGDTMNGTLALSGTTGVIAVNQGAQGASIDIRSSTVNIDSNAAYMTFHRPSKYAVRFGLDSDNKLKVGGWSMGNFAYEIVNANNFDTYIGSSTKLSSDYVAKTGATMTGNLSIRQNDSSGYVSLVTGNTTKPGYIAFFEPTGSRIGYIGWSSSNNTIDIKGENNYEFNFTTTPKIQGQNILSISTLQNPGVGAALLTGATSTYESGTVKEIYRTNTYLTLGLAGSNNDWAYLRQIGGDNNYHLALDVHDDGDDARFSLRSVRSTVNPDEVNTHLTITPTKTTLYTDLDVIAGTPTDFTGEAVIRIQGNRTDRFNANRLVFGDQVNADRYWMGTRGDKDGTNAKFILYYYNTEGGTNRWRSVLEISPNSLNSNSYSLNIKDSALTIDSSDNVSIKNTPSAAAHATRKDYVDTQVGGRLALTGGTLTGRLAINYDSPTIALRDTDHKSAFLHCNSDQFYILRSAGDNGTSWDSGPNGRHPMTMNLNNGNVSFSNDVFVGSSGSFLKLATEDFVNNRRLSVVKREFFNPDCTWLEGAFHPTGSGINQLNVIPEMRGNYSAISTNKTFNGPSGTRNTNNGMSIINGAITYTPSRNNSKIHISIRFLATLYNAHAILHCRFRINGSDTERFPISFNGYPEFMVNYEYWYDAPNNTTPFTIDLNGRSYDQNNRMKAHYAYYWDGAAVYVWNNANRVYVQPRIVVTEWAE